MAAPGPAAVAAGEQAGGGHHPQPRLGVEVKGLTCGDGVVVAAPLFGCDGVHGRMVSRAVGVSMTALWDDLGQVLAGARARLLEQSPGMVTALASIEAAWGRGPVALRRDHLDPGHLTASAFVVAPSGDRVLLIRHRTLGLWLQPGGHFEVGDETLVGAAAREAEEETGVHLGAVLSGLFHVDVHRVPANAKRGEGAHLHHDLRVLFRASALELSARDEVDAAAWFSWEELAALDTDDSVRAACAVIRGMGLAGA
jgi:8-oxo-dGTP pyrophosphatase MutT (NUDIX family)